MQNTSLLRKTHIQSYLRHKFQDDVTKNFFYYDVTKIKILNFFAIFQYDVTKSKILKFLKILLKITIISKNPKFLKFAQF